MPPPPISGVIEIPGAWGGTSYWSKVSSLRLVLAVNADGPVELLISIVGVQHMYNFYHELFIW